MEIHGGMKGRKKKEKRPEYSSPPSLVKKPHVAAAGVNRVARESFCVD
jgi:hypothetical protein